MRRRVFGAAVLFSVTVLLAAPAPCADETPIEVRAGYHDDFARIAFEWSSPVAFNATAGGNEVKITFDRPFTGALAVIPKRLPGLVNGATLMTDSRTIALSLTKPVELRLLRFGRLLVVDLFDSPPEAYPTIIPPAPPAPSARTASPRVASGSPVVVANSDARALAAIAPAAGAAAPAALEPSALRATAPTPASLPAASPAQADAATPLPSQSADRSSQPFLSIVPRELGGFSRVVFDWDRLVDYKVERAGNDLVVRFNSPALIEPMAKPTTKPSHYRAVDVKVEGDVTVVRIAAVAAGTKLRHFQRGNRIVLDLMDETAGDRVTRPDWAKQDAVAVTRVAPAAPEPKPARPSAPAGAKMATVPVPVPARPVVTEGAKPIPSLEIPATPQSAEVLPLPVAQPHASAPPAQTAEIAMPNLEAAKLEAKAPVAAEATVPAPETSPGPPAVAPSEPNGALMIGLGGASAPHGATSGATFMPAGPASLRVSADAIGAGVRLGFPFDRETGAAVFERLGFLWIVFDTKHALDLSGLDAAGPLGRAFVGAETLESETASVLRLALAPEIGAQAVRAGNTWFVELMAEPPRPLYAITVRAEPGSSGNGGRVTLLVTGAGSTITLTDPEVGDRLIAITSTTPGSGVAEARSFVQFKLLPSAQGIAIAPLGDALKVGAVASGIEITDGEALVLSPEPVAAEADRTDVAASDDLPMEDASKLFDYKTWRREDLGSFNKARQALQVAAADATGGARTGHRLELARLLFVHGHAADALGVLERVAAEDEAATREPAFLALRGATRLLAGHFEEAARDLDNQALDGDADATLWRGALAASSGDFAAADAAFSAAAIAYESLTPDFKRRFGLLATQSALALKNFQRAAKFLNDLKNSDGPIKPSEVAEIGYLEAQVAEHSGHQKAAIEDYEKLGEKREGPVGVRAAFAAIELKLERGAIEPEQAIHELERLRTAWRGDAYERQLLRRLAALYAGKKDYMNALTALRDAVELFPDAPGTPQLRDQMFTLMHSLFVSGDAEAMTPLEALGLYYEFEDSAPSGAEGGRIVEGLANKLIAIDLLDRAAALLEKQIGKLEGEDKARLGGRLAEVKLLDGKAEDAIATLKATESAKLATPLVQERQRVAARAEAALGRPKQGLALIASDTGKEAALIRIELQWDDQNWQAVAASVDQMYPAGATDAGALKPEDHARIMRAAVARALAHDTEGLGAMRARFADALKKTEHAGAFEFLTSSMAEDGVDMKELPKILANLDGIDALTGKAKTATK